MMIIEQEEGVEVCANIRHRPRIWPK